MVKKIALAVLLVVALTVGITLVKQMLTGEEARIRQRCQHLSTLLSMPPGEKLPAAALRAERLRGFLTETCSFSTSTYKLSRELSRDEVISRYLAVRRMLRSVDVLFKDIVVEPVTDLEATVRFMVRANATAEDGARESRTAPIMASLKKIDGKWRFAEFREETVLEK